MPPWDEDDGAWPWVTRCFWLNPRENTTFPNRAQAMINDCVRLIIFGTHFNGRRPTTICPTTLAPLLSSAPGFIYGAKSLNFNKELLFDFAT